MLKIIILFFIREKRNLLINRWTIPIRLVIALLNLTFYFYAAKAFLPNKGIFENLGDWSLFEFVALGELILFMALDSLIIFPQQLKRIISEGVFDGLIQTKTPLIKCLTLIGLSSYLLSLLTIIFEILCLIFIFDVSYPIINVLKVFYLNLISLPFFISLGLLSAALMLLVRRGVGLFATLMSSIGVLSGAYFPLEVFPEKMKILLTEFNPIGLLMSESRSILKVGYGKYDLFQLSLLTIFLSISFYFISNYIFSLALDRYRRRGEQLLLGQ